MHSLVVTAGVALALAAANAPAIAADASGASVVVSLRDIRSGAGHVIASLCREGAQGFPGACSDYAARARAHPGAVELRFEGVAPGRYALQAFHDENDNGRPDIPPEGYAFGNDAGYPPSFDAAAIKVDSDTRVAIRMSYLVGPGARPVQGSGAPAPQGVVRTDVRERGLYAELYVPAHTRPLPAIIMIGGSEGGLDTISRFALGFTAHGYAVLALAYWGEPGLPQKLEGVPLEYFEKAIAWLQARPEVDPKRIGLGGWSRGAEAALLVASRERAVKAVMAIAPTNLVWTGLNYQGPPQPAWTAAGKPVPFVIPRAPPGWNGAPLKVLFEAVLDEPDRGETAAIPVERINGPVLLISGDDDQLWPSAEMAERVMARLKAERFRHAYEHLHYPGAGHVVFVGDPAGYRQAMTAMTSSAFFGGSPKANAAAWADDWPRTLDFFDKALKR